MKKLLTIPAYVWAIICVFLIPTTFIGENFFAKKLATLPFMKVNPIYSGGDSVRSYQQDSTTVTINKPVFESLFGSSSEGFVQIKFSGEQQLPAFISSTVDYDNDSKPDFRLYINTLSNDTKFETLTNNVLGLNVSSKVKDYWIVRVNVLNTDKK